jgi:sporulation protein YlmC with PRC-barrel domain
MTSPATGIRPLPTTMDARTLLDHLIVDSDGKPAGRVDDLELRLPEGGGPPVLTALLSGSLALGPRLGGRLGTWWLSFGRRMRRESDPESVRIPIELVVGHKPGEIRIGARAADVGASVVADWVRDKVIGKLPGSGVDA